MNTLFCRISLLILPILFLPILGFSNNCDSLANLEPTISVGQPIDYTANGQAWTRYPIAVDNFADFPDSLFLPAPELAACGLNDSASRSWVNIFDVADNYVYGFCALTEASDLRQLWFAMPSGECPPEAIYIQITDRKCGFSYKSNLLDLTDYCPIDMVDTMETNIDCTRLTSSPIIELSTIEDYTANGQEWTRYRIPISNFSDFPDSLFLPAPDLAACGLNDSASRSWVNIFDVADNYVYGFCALTEASDLQQLWFAMPRGECPPEAIYVQITDRQCGHIYESNLLDLTDYCPIDTTTDTSTNTNCSPLMVEPILELGAIEDYIANGKEWIRYDLVVTNFANFPDSLFQAAPDLAPCGLNKESSQTWVHIFDQQDQRIYGFCALESAADLQNMWFATPRGECPPNGVYITMTDRHCAVSYTSNTIDLSNVCEELTMEENSDPRFFFVPSGISPNGDGLNDAFVIPELRDHPEKYPKAEVVIFNRWGDIVFQAKPYTNNWIGQNQKDGKTLPIGTYFYIARLDVGEGIIRQGAVSIFR